LAFIAIKFKNALKEVLSMKKYVFTLILAAAMLLALAACSENSHQNDHQNDHQNSHQNGDQNDYQPTDEDVAQAENPFATALLEYFADSAPMPYDVNPSTMAFMVNIDGASGVVAIRHPEPFFPEARLFVFTGLEVIYKDIGSVSGFPSSIGITQDGRPVKVSGDAGDLSYTLFGAATCLETHNDVIIYTLTLYAELVDFQNMVHNHYQFQGGFNEGIISGRTAISKEEFNELRTIHGLENLRIWFQIEDETEQILGRH